MSNLSQTTHRARQTDVALEVRLTLDEAYVLETFLAKMRKLIDRDVVTSAPEAKPLLLPVVDKLVDALAARVEPFDVRAGDP